MSKKEKARIELDIEKCGIGENLHRTSELVYATLLLKSFDLKDYLDVIFIKEMQETEQGKTYHAEGNVLIHTGLVMAKVRELFLEFAISRKEASILYLAALLHDVAKPETSFKSEGRVKCNQHDVVGFQKAKYILDACFIPCDVKVQVLSIIREHMTASAFLKQKASQKAYEKLAWRVNTRLLYLFVTCDYKGRIAKDIEKSVENIKEFKNNCIKYGIYGETPKKKLDDKSMEALVLVGAVASGKSTFASKYQQCNKNVVIISSDAIRAELCNGDATDQSKNNEVFSLFYKRIRENGKNKTKTIIVDATNINKRARLLQIIKSSGYNARIVFFDTKYSLSVERNKNRERVVPEWVIKKQYELLVYPNYSEADDIRIIIPQGSSWIEEGFPILSSVNIFE